MNNSNKKEYLNEESYQQAKKKIIKISLIVLIIGVLIGTTLIICGNVMAQKNGTVNLDLNNNANKSQRTEDEIQKDIDELESQIGDLELEIETLTEENGNLFINGESSSEQYKENASKIKKDEIEIKSLKNKLSKFNDEMDSIDSTMNNNIDQFEGIFNKAATSIAQAKYKMVSNIGIFIIILSVLGAGGIYIFAMRREILVFKTQQVMPVAQEGIEKMAPTIGNAAGTITQGIAKGITQGIAEGKAQANNASVNTQNVVNETVSDNNSNVQNTINDQNNSIDNNQF